VLIYLPPTMSPTETTESPDFWNIRRKPLPTFRREGVPRVVCEKSHMGRAPRDLAEMKMPLDDVSESLGRTSGFATHEQTTILR